MWLGTVNQPPGIGVAVLTGAQPAVSYSGGPLQMLVFWGAQKGLCDHSVPPSGSSVSFSNDEESCIIVCVFLFNEPIPPLPKKRMFEP